MALALVVGFFQRCLMATKGEGALLEVRLKVCVVYYLNARFNNEVSGLRAFSILARIKSEQAPKPVINDWCRDAHSLYTFYAR